MGLKIANHYIELAKGLNQQWKSEGPTDIGWLPTSHPLATSYIKDMMFAVKFAEENRRAIILASIQVLRDMKVPVLFEPPEIICTPHNYASLENKHWVHRKGSVHVPKGRLAVIPGSMGVGSYIVEGLGCDLSYDSCSHGAGRRMSRRQAKETVNVADFAQAISHTLTIANKGLLDESPQAYKPLEEIIRQQSNIIKPLIKLEPILTLKGGGE